MSLIFPSRVASRAFYCCVAATLGLTTLSVSAQEAPLTETVVVTGSRIRQDPLNQPAPLVTVDEADIAKTGQTSIGDMSAAHAGLGRRPQHRVQYQRQHGLSAGRRRRRRRRGDGRLRHLGPKRVLVLVDGIRWVNEASACGVAAATDLNTIPTSIIDHIEVLQDGASSIYGSDAIAGVVNIITKKNFNGVEFSGYGGRYDEGDGRHPAVEHLPGLLG